MANESTDTDYLSLTYHQAIYGSINDPRVKAWYAMRELATDLGISRSTDEPLPEDEQEENPLSPPGRLRSKTIAELWADVKEKMEPTP